MEKLIRKYKDASPTVRASMALLLSNIILKGLSMISGPIFTRIMPMDQYGIVSTFTSWQGVLSSVVTLNLASGVFNNGMLDFEDDRDAFELSLLFLSTVSAFIWGFFFLLFKDWFISFAKIPIECFAIMFIYFVSVPAFSLWSGRQRYEYKYRALSTITILSAVLSLVIGIIGVSSVPQNRTAMTRIIVMEGVNIVVGLFFYGLIVFRARFKVNFLYCKYALKFNLPLVPHYLSMYVLSSSDRIMITRMVNSSATAIYSVAYTAASVINIVWQSVDASLAPWIYEKLRAEDITSVKKVTVKIILLFAVICLLCTLFSPEIMMILAPAEYRSGIYVIPPVTAGCFFIAIYSLYMRLELYHKQTGFATIATSIAAVFNILLNYIFIRLYGPVAAGYTTLACYALLSMLHYLNVKRKGFSNCIDNKALLIVSISVITCSIFIVLLYDYPFIRFGIILLILVISVLFRHQIRTILKGLRSNE